MGRIIIERKIAQKIKCIFEHPDEQYSVYLKDTDETVWIDGKTNLYLFLQKLKSEI